MGAELCEVSEWAEARELDWWLLDHVEHRGIQTLVRDLNAAYRATPALFATDNDPAPFAWIDANDASRNVFSFVRRAPGAPDLVRVSTFSAAQPHPHTLGPPPTGERSTEARVGTQG